MAKKTVFSNGIQVWRNKKGELHRKNGPAVIYPNGDKYWYRKGKYWYPKGKKAHPSN